MGVIDVYLEDDNFLVKLILSRKSCFYNDLKSHKFYTISRRREVSSTKETEDNSCDRTGCYKPDYKESRSIRLNSGKKDEVVTCFYIVIRIDHVTRPNRNVYFGKFILTKYLCLVEIK